MHRKYLRCLFYSVLCLLMGFVSSRFQMDAIIHWYPTLHKSNLTPPNSVFPIAWSILYGCIGCSAGLLRRENHHLSMLYALFFLQLITSFIWSIAFFYLQNPLLGMIDIIFLDGLVLLYIGLAWRAHKTSAILFIPYLIWLLFATYLNVIILIYN